MAKKAKKRVVKKAARRGQVILPKKMSSLIAICLKDIKKAEALPKKFVIDMGEWFSPEDVDCTASNGHVIETHHICSVCAAGSVMAFTLKKADSDKELFPNDFPRNEKQLEAINHLRAGNAYDAAIVLGLAKYDDYGLDTKETKQYATFQAHIPEYDRDNPKPFHTTMGKLHDKLKKAGL